jgi:hypothetical protein
MNTENKFANSPASRVTYLFGLFVLVNFLSSFQGLYDIKLAIIEAVPFIALILYIRKTKTYPFIPALVIWTADLLFRIWYLDIPIAISIIAWCIGVGILYYLYKIQVRLLVGSQGR